MTLKALSKRFSPNPKTRKKARWKHLHAKAKQSGFEMYKSNLIWLDDPDFSAARNEWDDIPGMSADRAFFLYSTAQAIRGIPGDTADVGVRYGSSSFYMLKGFADPARAHHIFDSFEGLSAPTVNDRNNGHKSHWKKGDIAVEENVTKQCLSSFTNCHYYKGWVPTRFPDVADKKFAFLHVDVDLYQPTRDTLEFFYGRMNPGGVMVCDDYGLSTCPGARKAVNEFFAGKEVVFHLPSGQSLVIKR